MESVNNGISSESKPKDDYVQKDEGNQESASENESKDLKTSDEEVNIHTPKRSTRIKTKNEEKNTSNTSTSSIKLDDSPSSDSTTPKQNSRNSSFMASQGEDSLNESSTGSTNLTPKQLQKKLGSAKKREEREKERQDRERKRLKEKEERARQKQEKDEQRKREKEQKNEARRKEKEEKERQKELDRKLKEEKEEQKRKEKEEKEEQKRREKEAKEEEKRKRQEALEQEKLEQELKKKKAAEAFANFFVPKLKEKDQTTVGPGSKNNVLSSFTIKSDMRLAPTIRVTLDDDDKQHLNELLGQQNSSEDLLYLKSLKNKTIKPKTTGKTWPLSDKDDDDVMIIEDELPPIDGTGEIITCEPSVQERLRPKLLCFHENRRPPYWGTWRKKSKFIRPRRPLGQDQKQLDYEIDSDEEWEEEQEGESLDGSVAGSEDEQGPDEYEVDNEVFVPHGYLSDEEATIDEDDVLSLSPETQKARLKHLEDEFESELKKPTEKLKPRLYGLLWETNDGGKPPNCVDALWNYFEKFSMFMNDPTPFLQPSNESEDTEKKKTRKKKHAPDGEQSPKNNKKLKIDNKSSTKSLTEIKKIIPEVKKNTPDGKKNQLSINSFLTKKKT